MPLGVNGKLGELYVDIERLPRGDELFGTFTGYTNAPMAPVENQIAPSAMGNSWSATPRPTNLKTVRYFVREGQRSEATGVASTSLSPQLQAAAGGLVRQEIPRSERIFAEETGERAILESGQVVIAPEVVHMEIRYFDGRQIVDVWDMVEEKTLPLAIEVCIWLASPDELASASASYNPDSLVANAREYRQTIFLPMAELSQMSAMGGGSSMMGGSSMGTSGGGTSGSSSFGSGEGQP
jgi:hypothetical protein